MADSVNQKSGPFGKTDTNFDIQFLVLLAILFHQISLLVIFKQYFVFSHFIPFFSKQVFIITNYF